MPQAQPNHQSMAHDQSICPWHANPALINVTKGYRMITSQHLRRLNGWVILDKEQMDCLDPANNHVFEASVTIDSITKEIEPIRIAPYCCCGLPRKEECCYNPSLVVITKRSLRNKLADLENSGSKTCGTCVSHFYADKES